MKKYSHSELTCIIVSRIIEAIDIAFLLYVIYSIIK